MLPRTRAANRGFTLIEVMAAVVVLAMALAAIIAGFAQQASLSSELRDRTLAMIVARNQAAQVLLAEEFPRTGSSSGDSEFADAVWQWRMEVVETEDPELRRIDISVERSDNDRELATLSAFVSSTGRRR